MTIKQQGGIFGRNPSFNNLEVENSITSNGPATLSGPTGQTLTLKTTDLGGVGGDLIGGVLFYGSDASAPGEGVKSAVRALVRGGAGDGSELVFTTSDGSTNDIDRLLISKDGDINVLTGNLVIGTSGKGIDFSATGDAGGMTSELLDDYEEGTFTVVVADAASGGNVSSDTESGSYTKIGDVVHFAISGFNIDTTGLTAGNELYLRGFPYVSGNFPSPCTVWADRVNFDGTNSYLMFYKLNSSDGGHFYSIKDNDPEVSTKVSDFTDGVTDIVISGFYFAA